MKKAISLLLSLVLLFCVCLPAFGAEEAHRVNHIIPTVLITGDGEPIWMPDETAENGERLVFSTTSFLGLEMLSGDDDDDGSLYESIANVLKPFFAEGVLRGNWDPYYENLEKEVSDLFKDVRLDKNGDPMNGTNVSKDAQWLNWWHSVTDHRGDKCYFSYDDYHYWYDWRRDPMEIAPMLHDYIQSVKTVTGAGQVALFASCLGSNVALAYLKLYGPGDFYSIGIDATVSAGSEFMSEALAGEVKLDCNAINRFIADGNYYDWFNIPEFATATIDLAEKSGLLDGISKTVRRTLFDKVSAGVISALALGTFYTMPCYWACIDDAHCDTALNNVFGPEGSQKRQEYAGLIQKVTYYHENVQTKIPSLLKLAEDNGAFLCILAKYGTQQLPLLQSNDLVSDQFVSLKSATFGATTSTIYDTLPDDYLAQREAEGKGKYLSPDKQVDTSTCLYPDYTWVIKGGNHTTRSWWENERIYTVLTSDRQMTIDDFEGTPFYVFDQKTDITEPMTAENCHTEHWTADRQQDEPQSFLQKIRNAFQSFFRWCKALFDLLKERAVQKNAE